jgi:hypothetical protein
MKNRLKYIEVSVSEKDTSFSVTRFLLPLVRSRCLAALKDSAARIEVIKTKITGGGLKPNAEAFFKRKVRVAAFYRKMFELIICHRRLKA